MMTRTLPTLLLLTLLAPPLAAQEPPAQEEGAAPEQTPTLPDLPDADQEALAEEQQHPSDALPTPQVLRDLLLPGSSGLDDALRSFRTKQLDESALPPHTLAIPEADEPPKPPALRTADVMRGVLEQMGDLAQERAHKTSPLILHARWIEVTALYRDKKCTEALKLAREILVQDPGTMDLPIQYAFARVQMCSKRESSRGKKALRALAKGDGVIARAAARDLGITPKSPNTKRAKRPSKRALLEQAKALAPKELDAALEITRALRERGRRDHIAWVKLRRLESKWLWRAGRSEEAADAWRSVWDRARSWKRGFGRIAAEIARLEKKHQITIVTHGDRIDRLRTLILKGQFKQMRREERQVRRRLKLSKRELQGWRWYLQGLEKERRRKRGDAAALFAKADGAIQRPELRVRLYIGWARALRRLHRDVEAVALYDRVCQEFPMERFCAQATYQAGRLLQYLEKHEASRERFIRLAATHPESKHMAEALWRSALSSYLLQDWEMADRLLVHLGEHHGAKKDESELKVGLKAQYWRGVVALKRGDRAGAARHLQATIAQGPLTWYGRLASARLTAIGITPRTPRPPEARGLEAWNRLDMMYLPFEPKLEHGVTLARLGFFGDAMRSVRRARRRVARRDVATRLMAHLHLALGRADKAHWMMKGHIHPAGLSWTTLSDWKTAFPMAFARYARQFGQKYGVSPYLVQAIIRQESGFRPGAKSPAGALGLMQMMPRTARYTSRVFLEEDRKWRHKELFIPKTNVRLGSMYVRVHLAYAANHVALALAGYNAGPGALKRWFGQFKGRELDAWVESITYREARGYVRKVFTSYVVYSALYGRSLPDLDLTMPEKLGRWGVVKKAVTEVASR